MVSSCFVFRFRRALSCFLLERSLSAFLLDTVLRCSKPDKVAKSDGPVTASIYFRENFHQLVSTQISAEIDFFHLPSLLQSGIGVQNAKLLKILRVSHNGTRTNRFGKKSFIWQRKLSTCENTSRFPTENDLQLC